MPDKKGFSGFFRLFRAVSGKFKIFSLNISLLAENVQQALRSPISLKQEANFFFSVDFEVLNFSF
jgi:hypothetical protein